MTHHLSAASLCINWTQQLSEEEQDILEGLGHTLNASETRYWTAIAQKDLETASMVVREIIGDFEIHMRRVDELPADSPLRALLKACR